MNLWNHEGLKIEANLITTHPNRSATFKVTDQAWLVKNGWKQESYVEVQARPMPPDRKVPVDTWAWECGCVIDTEMSWREDLPPGPDPKCEVCGGTGAPCP